MKHDPEKTAAAYLAGVLRSRRRERFERHIVDCEQCWREVQLGRAGRSLAESGRELAPQQLREQVRAVVAAMPAPRARRVVVLAMGMLPLIVLTAAASYLVVFDREQPAVIAAVLTDYRTSQQMERPVPPTLPSRLGDLRYVSSYSASIEGLDVVAHAYRDPAGHKVVVYQADRTFPVAEDADHSTNGRTWQAIADGAVLFCADHPRPSLVVGDDAAEVTLAARELGLR